MNLFKNYIEYIKDNPEGYWFKRKCFGWGWTPATREGWTITGLFVLVIVWLAARIPKDAEFETVAYQLLLPLGFLTILLLAIAYKTGEKPKWQWKVPSSRKDYEFEKDASDQHEL